MSAILGILATGWSAVRSSKLLQYILIGVGVVVVFLLARRMYRKQGYQNAINDSLNGVIRRMENNREVHREIRDLPLSERARRLRELDRSD